jgi:hypothetical protein
MKEVSALRGIYSDRAPSKTAAGCPFKKKHRNNTKAVDQAITAFFLIVIYRMLLSAATVVGRLKYDTNILFRYFHIFIFG